MLLKKTTRLLPCLMLSFAAFTGSLANADNKVRWQEVRDLDFGHTLFEFFQRNYFSSIVYLTASQQTGKLRQHKDQANLLLGGMYLSYGMHDEAGQIFQNLIDQQANQHVRDRAWFYLAKIRYQRGYTREANEALARIGKTLPPALQEEKHLLQANTLLALQQYDEVRALLKQNQKNPEIWTLYTRYNLGVALINRGQKDEGRKWLEQVTKISPSNEEEYSLRDKANLSLGYSYIQENKPEPAIQHLRKVRLQGPLTNKALLGLGWAYNLKQEHKASLAPWLELRKRDVLDPAVQESLIASAYALNKLKAYAQSLQYYQNAITIYQSEMGRLDQGIQSIRNGNMLRAILKQDPKNQSGWFWELRQPPDIPESRYLLHLFASQRFQEALKTFRDLHQLQKNLAYWSENIDVFQAMLETRRQAYQNQLPRIQEAQTWIESNTFRQQRNQFKNRIAQIEQQNDVFGLANNKEQKLIARLVRMKKQLDTLPDHPRVRPIREKYRRMQGILYWQIASSFAPRIWEMKKQLKSLDQALEENLKRTEAMLQAQKKAPLYFENYRDRIDSLKSRLSFLQKEVVNQSVQLQDYLERLAIAELKQRQQRLFTYITQAQFAIAQIQDRSAINKEGNP
jgi:hypothetical protein